MQAKWAKPPMPVRERHEARRRLLEGGGGKMFGENVGEPRSDGREGHDV